VLLYKQLDLIIKYNGRLDGRLVPDAFEGLAELFQLEHLVDDTLCLDLARVEVVDGLCWFLSVHTGTQNRLRDRAKDGRKGATYETYAPQRRTQ
jgi:ABC-type transporter Mla MlaB component